MNSKPDDSCADNSDMQQREDATTIRELQGEELLLVAGGIRAGGLVSIKK